tara:strand:+ start:418 stop:1005 length:588 start_codon:yes stop_codon:yes gene_type:complete
MKIEIPPHIIQYISELQKDPYEHNGQINWNGTDFTVNSRPGQTMEKCTYCEANWHTHPDRSDLYPEHPSATDFKYVYNATCKSAQVGSHLVFTPSYIYVLSYGCKNIFKEVIDVLTINKRIDYIFESLAKQCDRSSAKFRTKWISALRNIGFEITIFDYSSKVYINKKTRYHTHVPFLLILIPVMFFYSKKYVEE